MNALSALQQNYRYLKNKRARKEHFSVRFIKYAKIKNTEFCNCLYIGASCSAWGSLGEGI